MPTITELMVRVGVQTGDFDKGLNASETKVAQLADSVEQQGQRISAGMAAAGVAAGAALGQGIASAIEFEAAHAKLSAQLGATEELSAAAGDAAGALYADAYGGSMAEVSEAVGAVVSSIDGMQDANAEAIQDMTGKAMTLADLFGIDVTRAAQVAGQMITTGFAEDGAQAMDLLTASMQAVPAAVREDLLDAVDEYGPFMQQIGVTGEQAMNLLVAGAEKGAFGLDKTGDSLKEFTLLATDMSDRTGEAYAQLGLDQEEMTNQLLAGGDTANAAFTQIVDGLLGIQDPAAQSQAAIALFGTPLEDLSTAQIPQFLESLTNTTDALGEVEGATDKAGETMFDTAQTKILGFQRQMETALAELVGAPGLLGDAAAAAGVFGGAIIPIAGDLGAMVLGIGGVVQAAPGMKTAFKGALDTITALPGQAKAAATGVSASFAAMSAAGKTATIGLGAIGIALAAAAVASQLFSESNAEAEQSVADLADTLDPATAAITADTEAKIANRLESQGLLEIARDLQIPFETVTGAALGNKTAMDDLAEATAGLTEREASAMAMVDGAGGALTDQEESARTLMEGVGGLSGELETAVAQQQRVAEGTEAAAAATEEHATAAERSAAATQEQIEAMQALAEEFKAQTDPVFAVLAAQKGLAEAQTAVNEALKEHGEGSPEYTEALLAEAAAGSDLGTALLEAGDAVGENLDPALATMLENVGTSGAAIEAFAEATGLTAQDVKDLATEMGLIPEEVGTDITTTAAEAGIPLADYLEKLEKADDPRLAELKSNAEEAGIPLAVYLEKLEGATVPRNTNFTSNAAEAGIPVDILEAKYQGATVPRATTLTNNATIAGIPVDVYEAKLQGATVPRATNITNNAGAAGAQVDAYNTKVDGAQRTVITTIQTNYVTTGARPFQGANAKGGPVSMGEVSLVGEEGPELVQFGASGHVIPADETAQILAGANAPGLRGMGSGGASGGDRPVVLEFHSGGSDIENLFLSVLRRGIRVRGGNAQVVLGQ